jgi:hypothetical protein
MKVLRILSRKTLSFFVLNALVVIGIFAGGAGASESSYTHVGLAFQPHGSSLRDVDGVTTSGKDFGR